MKKKKLPILSLGNIEKNIQTLQMQIGDYMHWFHFCKGMLLAFTDIKCNNIVRSGERLTDGHKDALDNYDTGNPEAILARLSTKDFEAKYNEIFNN